MGRKGKSAGRSPRRTKWLLVALAAAVALVVFPAISGATPSDMPTVTTGAADSVTNVSATLNGTVNPNDPDTTASYTYTFSWGIDQNNLASSQDGSLNGGTSDQPVSLPISGLSPNTTYYYQLCAVNSADSSDSNCGGEQSFTTDGPPTVTTGSASSLGQTSATLNGTVDPNDPDNGGTFTFSWGLSSNSLTSSGNGSFGAGTSSTAVSLPISSLTPDTTYYFQLCASNDYGGPICGTVQNFMTQSPPPTVTTAAATSITPTGATLNGSVNPNGSSTTYKFKWGTNMGGPYGNNSGNTSIGTTAQSVPTVISGLSPSKTYYFVLCATNGTGTTCGAELSFTTPDQPDVTTGNANQITPTSATIKGTVNPNGADTTYTFEWGTASGGPYPNTTSGPAGSGTTSVQESAQITGLSPHSTYFYVLCASNAFGSPCGTEKSFFAPDQPTSVTGGASAITTSSATLSGTVNPNGANVTSVYFNYGTTTTYTSTTNATPSAPGAGTSPVSESASLTGLAAGVTFHYQLCAVNTWGTGCGADQTFATNAPPTAALTANTTSGPTPLAVTFDGSGSKDSDGSIASWTLTFGDGSSTGGNGPVPNAIPHTYTAACSCTASLKVTDNQAAQSTAATVAIHVTTNQPPVSTLTAMPTSGTVPLAVSFDGSASHDPDNIPLQSWSLDFGDLSSTGGSGAVPNAIPHTYATAGTYKAVLTVTDSSNASTKSAGVTITVKPQPTISVGDVSLNEGNSGTTNFVFPVTLSAVSTQDVTVGYATADGTATAGSDYTAASGTLTIPANTDCTTSNPACTITVKVSGDSVYENNETFALNLSSPTGATIADGAATGTILNDDPQPVLMITNNAILEGNSGSKVSGPQTWSAGGSLALADASGFTHPPNSFSVSTPGSTSVTTYTFQGVSGNTLTGVSPGGSVASGQIAFQPHTLTLDVLLCDPSKMPQGTSDVSDCEGDDAVPKGAETTSGVDTTVQYATVDGTSRDTHIAVVKGQDYLSAAGTLTIKAGQKSGQITFQTIPNTTPENPTDAFADLTRWFTVNLSNPTAATVAWGAGTAEIIEDDGPNPPTATTGAASGIGISSATVSGTVNPNGVPTNVYVQYGTDLPYRSQTAMQSLPGDNAGDPVSFTLTGLSPGTTYHYQVVAVRDLAHGDAAGYGADRTFTTDRSPTAALGASTTSGPTPLTVRFDGSGSFDPDGTIASWTLTFGDGSSTGGSGAVPSAISHVYKSACSCTARLTVTDNLGAQSQPATLTINAIGNQSLPPPPPGVTSPVLSDLGGAVLGPTKAKVVLTVDPNGGDTKVWIQYGVGLPYDESSKVQIVRAGAKKTLTFVLTGLTAGKHYGFRVDAAHTTDPGSAATSDVEFTTPKTKPMRVVLKARTMNASANGVVSLPLYCTGNALPRCRGQALLELGNLAAGFKSFSLLPKHRALVRVALKKTMRRQLLANGPLHLTLTLSVRSGFGGIAGLKTTPITVLPPARRK